MREGWRSQTGLDILKDVCVDPTIFMVSLTVQILSFDREVFYVYALELLQDTS